MLNSPSTLRLAKTVGKGRGCDRCRSIGDAGVTTLLKAAGRVRKYGASEGDILVKLSHCRSQTPTGNTESSLLAAQERAPILV